MKIITDRITLSELKEMAAGNFSNLVKAVVDAQRELLAVNSELHSDLEGILLENGSKQKDLWGINLYPDKQGDGFIEYDSMINLRPSQDNPTRGVESEELRQKIVSIVETRISR